MAIGCLGEIAQECIGSEMGVEYYGTELVIGILSLYPSHHR